MPQVSFPGGTRLEQVVLSGDRATMTFHRVNYHSPRRFYFSRVQAFTTISAGLVFLKKKMDPSPTHSGLAVFDPIPWWLAFKKRLAFLRKL